jgi:predicted alpha/beta-fold hydrolase
MPARVYQTELVPPLLHGRGVVGGHLQTILAATRSAAPQPAWLRERWLLMDGDFIDADWLHQTDTLAPLLVLFHGLEGSSASHYARSIGAYFQARGWRVCVPHFRGCNGEPNLLLRAYHSGDANEIERLLTMAYSAFSDAPLYAAGVSLGGNALLCYSAQLLHRHGAAQPEYYQPRIPLRAIASICAPLDLARCGEAISTGFARVYTWMFMRTLRAKALEKRQRFPKACDWDAIIRSKNLAQFDDAFTAPVHGYRDAADYYANASAKPKLKSLSLPTLLLNSYNDPFVPADVLADLNVSSQVMVHHTAQGGHVGFASGAGMGELNWLPQRLYHWFTEKA